MDFSIPAQPLDRALRLFSEQSRHQVLFDEAAVSGQQAPAVNGRYTPREALDRLLSGTKVRVNGARPDVFTLTSVGQPSGADAVTLQAVTVSGGSLRDPTTEQTGSYTSGALTMSKMTQSIRETPQSVSVITRKQLDDRNLTTLEEALAQTTGVTKTARNFGNHKFSIRGFTVDDNNYLVDGVAGIVYAPVGWLPIDTAVFDRVEVLRGAGGMMLGSADPSGAINMVRKRPRGEGHLEFATTVGSWDNYRTEIDAGGPINAAGTVRGRLVTAYQDRHYFYSGTKSKTPLFYGVIDADLGQDTTLTFGARHQATNTDGYWLFGLPRYGRRRAGRVALDVADPGLEPPEGPGERSLRRSRAPLQQGLEGAPVAQPHRGRPGPARGHPGGRRGPDHGQGVKLFHPLLQQRAREKRRPGPEHHGQLPGAGRHASGTAGRQLVAPAHPPEVREPGRQHRDRHLQPRSRLHSQADPSGLGLEASRMEQTSLYGSTRLQLADPLHLLLGGKFSWLKYRSDDGLTGKKTRDYEQKHEFTPYAGLVYDLNDQWSVYTSYADTYQPQSTYVTSSGKPLDPSIGANYEAGVKGELYGGRLNLSAAVFAVKKSGMAVEDLASAGNCGLAGLDPVLPQWRHPAQQGLRAGGQRRTGARLAADGRLHLRHQPRRRRRDDQRRDAAPSVPPVHQLPAARPLERLLDRRRRGRRKAATRTRPMTTRPCAWARPDARCGTCARGIASTSTGAWR